MTETPALPHIANLPERYYHYVVAQSRVSNWVSQTNSTQQGGRKTPSRRGSKSSQCAHGKLSTNAHSLQHLRSYTRRKASRDDRVLHTPEPRLDPLPPVIALVSSSLVVCAFLPSLLVVSAFVTFLAWISMDDEVYFAPDELDTSLLILIPPGKKRESKRCH